MKKIMLNLIVNGEKQDIEIEPNELLVNVVREKLGLTGAKYACGTGQCGACTVVVNGEPVLGCLTLAASVNGVPPSCEEISLYNGKPKEPNVITT